MKPIGLLLLLVVLASGFGLQTLAVDMPLPVGMWLFEEENDTMVKDSSLEDNDGEIKGSLKRGTGKFGKGLVFDGVNDNYVEIPDSDSLDMTENISVLFWFSTTKLMSPLNRWSDRQVVVGKNVYEYEVGIYDSGIIHTYTNGLQSVDAFGHSYDEGISISMADTIDPEFRLDTWYHVAWTLDGKIERVYVNGIEFFNESGKPYEKNTLGTLPGNNPLEIGRRPVGGEFGGELSFKGTLDEVAVYNVTLDADQIKEIVEVGLAESFNQALINFRTTS